MEEFNTQPSAEYLRLRAEVAAARDRLYANPDKADEQWNHDYVAYQAAKKALEAMPEAQYLAELEDVENEAARRFLAAEVRRHGRMVSIVAMKEGYGGFFVGATPEAIDNDDTIMVKADTRHLSAADVAAALRKIAKHIEEEGLLVYRGPHPIREGGELLVDEYPNGQLIYKFQRN